MPALTSDLSRSFSVDILRIGDCLEMLWVDASLVPAQVVDMHSLWDRPNPQFVSKAMGSDRAISAADLPVAMAADAASPYKAFALSFKARTQALFKRAKEPWGNGITPSSTCSSPSPVMRVAHSTGERLPDTFINDARANVLGSHRVIVHLEGSGV